MRITFIVFHILIFLSLAAVSTLYFVEHNKQQQQQQLPLDGYQSIFRTDGQSRLSDEERLNFQHNLQTLFKNKTYAWPKLVYATSTMRPTGGGTGLRSSGDMDEAPEEELTAVMSNPQVNQPLLNANSRITTTAPRNANKTIASKNKSKWPVSQEALRLGGNQGNPTQKQLQRSAVVAKALVAVLNGTTTTSSEKPQGLPLSQDFENNSIDVDAQLQQQQQQQQLQQQLKQPLKLDEHIVVVGTIASTAVDGAAVVDVGQTIRKLNAGDAAIYNVYKTVSPPTANLALTTNKVSTEQTQIQSTLTLAVDVPPPAGVRNSSGANKDSIDALDLQNLSNTNESESVDNPITALFGFEYSDSGLRDSSVGRRSANQRSLDWIRHKSLKTPIFGQPQECSKGEAVSDNCQVGLSVKSFLILSYNTHGLCPCSPRALRSCNRL